MTTINARLSSFSSRTALVISTHANSNFGALCKEDKLRLRISMHASYVNACNDKGFPRDARPPATVNNLAAVPVRLVALFFFSGCTVLLVAAAPRLDWAFTHNCHFCTYERFGGSNNRYFVPLLSLWERQEHIGVRARYPGQVSSRIEKLEFWKRTRKI